MSLIVVTRRLDQDVDLLAVAGPEGVLFEQAGCGLAGQGSAASIPVPEIDSVLATIEVDDEVQQPGTGPVAFGSLPFAGGEGVMTIPELVVGHAEDGSRWVTTIGPERREPELPLLVDDAPTAPHAFEVGPTRPPEEWCDAVVEATKRIASTELHKVVLAREVLIRTEGAIDRAAVLSRLRQTYPGCMITSVDGMVGASPELLVSRAGDIVRSHPMAGTTPRGGDPTTDARLAASLLASDKDRHEHQLTIDMVHDTLLPWCSYLDAEAEPSVVPVANVQHLATLVEGRLSSPPPSVVELVLALHPTPAVCGVPRALALDTIAELEGFDRGRYAGPVGWVDADGNGRWAVGIRSAEIHGATARLFAGNGIVADSDPVTELAETRAKFQAMLSAIVRP